MKQLTLHSCHPLPNKDNEQTRLQSLIEKKSKENDLLVSLYGRYAADTVDVPVTPPGSPRVKLDNYFVVDF